MVFYCYEFEVLEMDNRRILKVKFTVNEPAGEGSETEILFLFLNNISGVPAGGAVGKQMKQW